MWMVLENCAGREGFDPELTQSRGKPQAITITSITSNKSPRFSLSLNLPLCSSPPPSSLSPTCLVTSLLATVDLKEKYRFDADISISCGLVVPQIETSCSWIRSFHRREAKSEGCAMQVMKLVNFKSSPQEGVEKQNNGALRLYNPQGCDQAKRAGKSKHRHETNPFSLIFCTAIIKHHLSMLQNCT